jgi:hypothetical protein
MQVSGGLASIEFRGNDVHMTSIEMIRFQGETDQSPMPQLSDGYRAIFLAIHERDQAMQRIIQQNNTFQKFIQEQNDIIQARDHLIQVQEKVFRKYMQEQYNTVQDRELHILELEKKIQDVVLEEKTVMNSLQEAKRIQWNQAQFEIQKRDNMNNEIQQMLAVEKSVAHDLRHTIQDQDRIIQSYRLENHELKYRLRLTQGKCWAILENLESQSQPSTIPENLLADLSKEIVFFRKSWPKPEHYPLCRETERKQHRNFFKIDLWGNIPDHAHEVSHLLPHSKNCNKHWKLLVLFFTGNFRGSPSMQLTLDTARNVADRKLQMYIEGYSDVYGITIPHSSLTDSTANHIMMRGQWWMDVKQAFLLVPLLTFHDMLHWDGHAYDFVFIPTCSNVFMDVQACTEEALKRAHTMTSLDPKVQQGFESMSLTLIAFINIMKHHELTADEAASARNHFQQVLRFIKTAGAFPTPKLPAKEVSLRFGSFAPGVCPLPGTSVSSTLIQGHPAPHPLLLHARNANAWLSFLWRKRGQGDARFRGPLGLDAMADGPSQAEGGCVLFPSCPDLSGF